MTRRHNRLHRRIILRCGLGEIHETRRARECNECAVKQRPFQRLRAVGELAERADELRFSADILPPERNARGYGVCPVDGRRSRARDRQPGGDGGCGLLGEGWCGRRWWRNECAIRVSVANLDGLAGWSGNPRHSRMNVELRGRKLDNGAIENECVFHADHQLIST